MARLRNPNGGLHQGILCCRMLPEHAEAFDALAEKMGLTVSALLNRLVMRALQGQDVDLIREVREAATAEAHAAVARVVRFSLVPYFRELREYHEQLQREAQELQERFKRYLEDLKGWTNEVAAYANDLKPLIERYAPDALEDELEA